ncbi:hypothetical protein OPQ81_010944 [Rhizoctonia solani]|nr:hypothetical protein OPQ81_010944 [Rhizoctonia solani]
MGRTKKQRAAAAKDEPGPDDYTFLAVFFPVGRSGAALARDDDPNDIKAAQRIGRWMHEAGLPIRKLFSRKSEEHIIVEVRKEVPEEVINSKLGAYKWVDTILDTSKIPPQFRGCETTILRARVRSHDAIEKMGGMVYFPIEPIIPTGPRSESQFKNPFPKPKRVGYAEPSTFSIIRYHPLLPEFTIVEDDDTQPDVKPDVKPDIKPDIKPEIKPDIKPSVGPDIKPSISRNGDQALVVSKSIETEIKPRPEADVKPKAEELPPRPNVDMNPAKGEESVLKAEPIVRPNWDVNSPPEKRRVREEVKPKIEEIMRPSWDMNPSAEERGGQERSRLKDEEQIIRPNWDMNPSTEERLEQERRRLEFEGQERPRESGPSAEQGKIPAEPADAQYRKPEASPTVKVEPPQPPAVQKRSAEDGIRREREVKRERLA